MSSFNYEESESPLSLNIFVALSIGTLLLFKLALETKQHCFAMQSSFLVLVLLGASLMGDARRAHEYYMIARQQLRLLFDCSDYAVAEALFGIHYFQNTKSRMEREGISFLSLLSITIINI